MKHDHNRLEDRLVEFAAQSIDLSEALPDTRAGRHVGGQILRCGTSPAPNYGEAQSAESRKDFIHKMKVALKELRETRVWLKIVAKKQYCDSRIVQAAQQECTELIAIFIASVNTAKRNAE